MKFVGEGFQNVHYSTKRTDRQTNRCDQTHYYAVAVDGNKSDCSFVAYVCMYVCCVNSLQLMAVYNVSINQKGFKYLRSKSNLITQLAWLVQSTTLTLLTTIYSLQPLPGPARQPLF